MKMTIEELDLLYALLATLAATNVLPAAEQSSAELTFLAVSRLRKAVRGQIQT